MNFNQDLRLNLRYDFGKMNSTLGSVVPLAMFPINSHIKNFFADFFVLFNCSMYVHNRGK